MAERKKKGVVAPKYQQTVSRATPQAITALVKKLPAEAGPIEARKKALYDLTLMISNVTQQDQDALLKTSEEHNLVGILATLLKDAEEAEREAEQAGEEAEDADVSAIKVGGRLGKDYVAKLYVLTLYVNLCFIGGAEQLRNPPTGMELLFDTVLETADESGESGDTLIYYATAGPTTAARNVVRRVREQQEERLPAVHRAQGQVRAVPPEGGARPLAAQTACLPAPSRCGRASASHTGNGTTSQTSGRPSASSSTAYRPRRRRPRPSLRGRARSGVIE